MATILCDLDGTLLVKTHRDPPDSPGPKRLALNRALAEVCDCPGVDFVQGMVHGLTDWLIAEKAVQVHKPDFKLDGPTWQAVVGRAQAVFMPPAPGAEPLYEKLPGIPETLMALKKAGHTLGIVTGNVAFFALYKLDQVGLDRGLFNGPVGFGDHGREREHILRLAMARSEDPAMVVLGDTVHDHAGARAVGLPFLGTGSMGLEERELQGAEGAAVGWVADLSEVETVIKLVDSLVME